jgi:hypothetical protein
MSSKWDRIEKLTLAGTTLTLISILVSAFFIYMQLRHGNMLLWKAELEKQSHELARLETVTPSISCIYNWNDKGIKNDCVALLRKPAGRRQALMYISQILSVFSEIRGFSEENDKGYARGYGQWIDEIVKLDITSYFLFINKMDANQAFKEYGIKINDCDIKKGYLKFKHRIGLKNSDP